MKGPLRLTATATAGITVAACLNLVPASTAVAASPARANDFNGDGRRDLAVGDPGAQVGSVQTAGQVRVIYGASTGLNSKPTQTISQNSTGIPGTAETNDGFGSSLVSADFNVDGYADLAIGDDNEFVTGAGRGSVTIVFGSSTGLSTKAIALNLNKDDSLLDPPVVGDLNKDGRPDLVIPGLTAPSILYGSTSLSTSTPVLHRLPSPSNNVDGDQIEGAAIGDVNGDGRVDLTVPYASPATGWKAAIAYYPGTATGLGGPVRASAADDHNDIYGPVGMGDFNGDHFADLVVANSGQVGDPVRPGGEITVWYGGATPFGVRDKISQDSGSVPGGGEKDDLFGYALAVGDVNGDGRSDVAVGGPGEDFGNVTDGGAVWVIYGGTRALGSSSDQMFTQSTAGVPGTAESRDGLGSTVSLMDLNNDGKADLIASAPGDRGIDVLHGSASGITTGGAQGIAPVSNETFFDPILPN